MGAQMSTERVQGESQFFVRIYDLASTEPKSDSQNERAYIQILYIFTSHSIPMPARFAKTFFNRVFESKFDRKSYSPARVV